MLSICNPRRRNCNRVTKRLVSIGVSDRVDFSLSWRRRRRGEGGGCRDIRAGYERVLQEVQNVIFDIPKSFQLIKAPAPSGFKRPRQPERLLEVAPSRYISAKRVGWATLGKHRASGVIWIEFNIRSLFKISSTSLESRRRSCSWMLKIMIVRDLVG